ncbi:MAG TPA: PqqD family protein [Candidatus Binatia bacterium]|nr:PqqD family protein [Candidatus Binatia bacterium]
MNPTSVPKLHPDVIWRVLDDGAVIVTPRAGNVRVLNSVGTTIWQLIDGENSLADIESHLVHRFDVSPERARNDLHSFVKELDRRDMIEWKDGPAD